jgi:hypothetical protein
VVRRANEKAMPPTHACAELCFFARAFVDMCISHSCIGVPTCLHACLHASKQAYMCALACVHGRVHADTHAYNLHATVVWIQSLCRCILQAFLAKLSVHSEKHRKCFTIGRHGNSLLCETL